MCSVLGYLLAAVAVATTAAVELNGSFPTRKGFSSNWPVKALGFRTLVPFGDCDSERAWALPGLAMCWDPTQGGGRHDVRFGAEEYDLDLQAASSPPWLSMATRYSPHQEAYTSYIESSPPVRRYQGLKALGPLWAIARIAPPVVTKPAADELYIVGAVGRRG